MARQKGDRQKWLKRVQRWMDGDLSAREFGNEIGVDSAALSRWKHVLKKEGLLPADTPAAPRSAYQREVATARIKPRLTVVTPMHEAPVETRDPYEGRFELCVGTTTIWVPPGFDETTLRRLLVIAREAEADQGEDPPEDDEVQAEDDHEAEAAE